MGATIQWRRPPERPARLHGEIVQFGRGRSRGEGYLAHSDRVGPGVLIVGRSDLRLADDFAAEGFTALLSEAASAPEVLEAAALFLTENWHPRLGIVAFGETGTSGARHLEDGRVSLDVLVLTEGVPPEGVVTPVAGHYSAGFYTKAVQHSFETIAERGIEFEVHLYETATGFWNPQASAFSEPAAGLALSRTVEALEYYLS